MATIGVLALQGGYAAHAALLTRLGHTARAVRATEDLDGIAGLVLPGGESSAMLKLIDRSGLREPLDAFVATGQPVLATCAGLILAAAHVTEPVQASFGWLDVDVTRNAWGRQVHSFEAGADDVGAPLIFIRAPRITRVGPELEVITRFRGEPVAVRGGAVVGASYHPELADDATLHALAFGHAV